MVPLEAHQRCASNGTTTYVAERLRMSTTTYVSLRNQKPFDNLRMEKSALSGVMKSITEVLRVIALLSTKIKINPLFPIFSSCKKLICQVSRKVLYATSTNLWLLWFCMFFVSKGNPFLLLFYRLLLRNHYIKVSDNFHSLQSKYVFHLIVSYVDSMNEMSNHIFYEKLENILRVDKTVDGKGVIFFSFSF